MKRVGVLAFHGDVVEHIHATQLAAKNLKLPLAVLSIRTNESLGKIDGLIIPGGESTTLYKLCKRERIWDEMKKIKNIFGTCAGAIMLAKKIQHKTDDQETLELMDIEVDRNAYGRQTESFEKPIKTKLGNLTAVFIRAPRIKNVGSEVKTLATSESGIIACEQKGKNNYYLATCFHPEITSSLFHEYFLSKIYLSG